MRPWSPPAPSAHVVPCIPARGYHNVPESMQPFVHVVEVWSITALARRVTCNGKQRGFGKVCWRAADVVSHRCTGEGCPAVDLRPCSSSAGVRTTWAEAPAHRIWQHTERDETTTAAQSHPAGSLELLPDRARGSLGEGTEQAIATSQTKLLEERVHGYTSRAVCVVASRSPIGRLPSAESDRTCARGLDAGVAPLRCRVVDEPETTGTKTDVRSRGAQGKRRSRQRTNRNSERRTVASPACTSTA